MDRQLRASGVVIVEDSIEVPPAAFQLFQLVSIPKPVKFDSPRGVIIGILYISPLEPSKGDRAAGWHYAVSRVFGTRNPHQIDARTPIEHFSEGELLEVNQ